MTRLHAARNACADAVGPDQAGQLPLDFDQRQLDVAVIHKATGIYTALPEVEALLERLNWPAKGQRLLDPGAGNGGFLVASLRRLDLPVDDFDQAARRVRGYEFYPGAVSEARCAVRDHLIGRGWSRLPAHQAALQIVEDRDFLLTPPPAGFDVLAVNPPYWRLANLPPGYRADYESIVPAYARADLLYSFLDQAGKTIAPGGRIGLITADRWLLNNGSSELRRRLGSRFRVTDVCRLDPQSSFYRAKERRKGSLPRVHPVSLILTPGRDGRCLGAEPFRLEAVPEVDGVPLRELAGIRLAPWLGPDGIFMVGTDSAAALPQDHLVPVAEPEDIVGGELRPARKWALVTGPAQPHPAILAHLDACLHRMPPRGRRNVRWLPPETFAGRLPLQQDAVLVPRIARQLKAVRLPAGRLPVNHQLVVISGLPAADIISMLHDPAVQAQADALALQIENNYRSYTATLLRQLIIPHAIISRRPALTDFCALIPSAANGMPRVPATAYPRAP